MPDCYIAIGSNLGDSLETASAACRAVDQLADCQLLKQSCWYQSKAIGPGEQPDYINGVIRISTSLQPLALLDALQAIEESFGRTRSVKWAPRTLDLDILLYGNEVISTDRLTVPHPEMHRRNFVIYPLHELNPKLVLPNGTAISTLLTSVSATGLDKLDDNAEC
jgi:2-amino-4-hydroxy-6-hydroxymethyldihydropteridine diphosphokinase